MSGLGGYIKQLEFQSPTIYALYIDYVIRFDSYFKNNIIYALHSNYVIGFDLDF